MMAASATEILQVAQDQIDRLTAENARLREIVREFVRIRDWVIEAGGTEGPMPQIVIEQFARMQAPAYDAARAALKEPT